MDDTVCREVLERKKWTTLQTPGETFQPDSGETWDLGNSLGVFPSLTIFLSTPPFNAWCGAALMRGAGMGDHSRLKSREDSQLQLE